MSYIYTSNVAVTNEVEIKNDANAAITVNVANNAGNVTYTNPFPVVVTNNTQSVDFPKGATSAFGELSTVQNSPNIQIDATYGSIQDSLILVNISGGTCEANAQTSMFTANSGTTTGGLGTVDSRRFLRYRPGQGAIGRISALFTLSDSVNKYGVDGATQRAGLHISGSGYDFGFSGDTANTKTKTFGVCHSYAGVQEIRTLTFTVAPTGTQTVTITLNGTAYTATVHAGTTSNAAAEIASTLQTSAAGVWYVDQDDGIIRFSGFSAGPKAGAYSFSASGTGTLVAATFTRTVAGVATTNDWTYQADWNGTGIAGLDPSKLNVYQIDYRWLGAGIVRFFIENPDTGEMTLVHSQKWANRNTIPHINVPSLRIGWLSAVTGTPSQPALVKGASAMGAIQGNMVPTTFGRSWYSIISSLLSSGNIWHLLSIRNPYMKDNKQNSQEIQIQSLSVATQGQDPSIIHIFVNGTPSTKLSFTAIPNNHELQSTQNGPTFDTAVDTPICSLTHGINSSSVFDLLPYRITLTPGDVISVTIQSSAGISRASACLNWIVD